MICTDTDIKLTVTPSVLSKSARWVNVTWSNVLLPKSSDWIGLWVLSDAEAASIDPKHHAPVKYKVYVGSSLFTSVTSSL